MMVLEGKSHTGNNNANNEMNPSQKSTAGPLLFPGSTLYEALIALEQYHSGIAEKDAYRWRMASNTSNKARVDEGVLASLLSGTRTNYHRAERREKALIDSQELLAQAESNLRERKEISKKLWTKVNKLEDEVNRKVEEKLRQRSRDREMKRRQEENERQAALSDGKLNSMVTQQEIWVSNHDPLKVHTFSYIYTINHSLMYMILFVGERNLFRKLGLITTVVLLHMTYHHRMRLGQLTKL